MKQKITSLVLFAAMAGWLASSAWGQQVTAAFTGKLTDPPGAALAGAKVTATEDVKTTISAQGIDFNRFEEDLHA